MSKTGHLACAPVVLTMLLLAAVPSAESSDKAFGAAPAGNPSWRIIVAQTSHAPPPVPGSTGFGGSSNGSHAPPPVPGSTNLGGSSNGSPMPTPVPDSTDIGGASGASHASPPVPGAGVSSHGNSPAPNGTGLSHASPQVPLMGGNP